jgi:uncharacterized membrane protein YoaK (UPF0700 family)
VRARFAQHRALFERAILGFVLPAVAGAINASGFFAVGAYTSHMSGNVARFGDDLATAHFSFALHALILVLSFMAGAMLCTFLVRYGRRLGGPPYWRPLILEAIIVFIFATFSVGAGHGAHLGSTQMTALLCCAMGVQNAMVTKLSGARIRTTHMTGVATDIGIEVARSIDDLWHRKYETPHKLHLHLAVLISFTVGATLGPLGYLSFGHLAMLFPDALLVLLAAFDVVFGLSAHTMGMQTDPALPPLPRERL